MKLLFLDTETTGLDKEKNAVVQISGIVEVDGVVQEEFNLFCAPFPGQTYTESALKITGKTVDEIKAYPNPKETYKQFVTILDKYVDRFNKLDKFYMVGQNTKFDYDFLTSWFKLNGNNYFYGYVNYYLIDLIQATAMFTIAGILKLKDMKLATVAEHFGVKLEAHNAINDIRATREVFYKYIDWMKK